MGGFRITSAVRAGVCGSWIEPLGCLRDREFGRGQADEGFGFVCLSSNAQESAVRGVLLSCGAICGITATSFCEMGSWEPVDSYRSFKRSLSEGNMVCESTTDSSSNVEEGNSQKVQLPVDAKKEGLSEFTPEIPTCGRDASYSRQLFADSEHDYFHQIRFDESSSSNFLDLDHISSSGNSCAEEIYESACRSSSENVITDTIVEATPSTTWEGSSDMATAGVKNSDVGEFSERFVHWVNHGGALCY